MIKVSNYMYGEDGEPWLSMRLWYWKEKGTIDVWAYFLTARYCVELIFWMSCHGYLLYQLVCNCTNVYAYSICCDVFI